VRDDGDCTTGNGKFDQMVVSFVSQIWPPKVIDVHPPPNRRNVRQKRLSLPFTRNTIGQTFMKQRVLILREQG
jgi:hypothetical protein